MDHTSPCDPDLPDPGPPFRVGERVAFFPVQVGPPSLWLSWDFAIIDEIDDAAETFRFHFEGKTGVQHSQGLENIVRISTNYTAWRSAFEEALARTESEIEADRETSALWRRVVAEHPIYGPDVHRRFTTSE